jgi:hypothetical protein
MQIEGELCEESGVGDGPAQRNPRDNRRIHQRPPESSTTTSSRKAPSSTTTLRRH